MRLVTLFENPHDWRRRTGNDPINHEIEIHKILSQAIKKVKSPPGIEMKFEIRYGGPNHYGDAGKEWVVLDTSFHEVSTEPEGVHDVDEFEQYDQKTQFSFGFDFARGYASAGRHKVPLDDSTADKIANFISSYANGESGSLSRTPIKRSGNKRATGYWNNSYSGSRAPQGSRTIFNKPRRN